MSVQNMDLNKKIQTPFGAYVQVSKDDNPTNTNNSKTLDTTYLKPVYNKREDTDSCIYKMINILQDVT